MKSHASLSPRQLLYACIALVLFMMITIFLFTCKRDEKRFQHLSNEIFVEEMKSNTLNMHYTIAYPEDFGIYQYQPILPCYSTQGRINSQAVTENTLVTLRSIDPGKLSSKDAMAYQLLLRSLENSLEKSNFQYYDEPLSPHSGMQSQLPILLAEYTFRSKRDVEDYLKLLQQTDDYFSSLLVFEQEKAAAGLLMPASSLKKVVEQCDTIVTKEQLETGAHFLQTTFQERIQELLEAQELSREEALSFLTLNDRLLKEVMLPSYEDLADGLFLLTDTGIPVNGLAALPEGTAYYEVLLINETGSYRPVSEIKQMLSEQFDSEYQIIHDLLLESSELQQWYLDGAEIVFPLSDADAMLSDLQQRMAPDFPALEEPSAGKSTIAPPLQSSPAGAAAPAAPSGDGSVHTSSSDTAALPQVTVKSVSPSLEAYCAPAFYLTTPIDDTDSNVIYINEMNSPTGLELYTTLAHEGYPGHLYQNVYCSRAFTENSENKIRQLLWYGGYLEGWALYTEFISFDYASALLEEHGQPVDALGVQLEKHNRSLQLCLYSLLDIMIHYENASYSQVAKVLENFGIRDSSSAARVYTYIAEEPCNYLKYYLGYLEILKLQDIAAKRWGADYSDYAFHSFLLECGPADFTVLEDNLLSFTLPEASNTALGESSSFFCATPSPGCYFSGTIFSSDHKKSGLNSAMLFPAPPAPPGSNFPPQRQSSAGGSVGAVQMLFSLFP